MNNFLNFSVHHSEEELFPSTVALMMYMHIGQWISLYLCSFVVGPYFILPTHHPCLFMAISYVRTFSEFLYVGNFLKIPRNFSLSFCQEHICPTGIWPLEHLTPPPQYYTEQNCTNTSYINWQNEEVMQSVK